MVANGTSCITSSPGLPLQCVLCACALSQSFRPSAILGEVGRYGDRCVSQGCYASWQGFFYMVPLIFDVWGLYSLLGHWTCFPKLLNIAVKARGVQSPVRACLSMGPHAGAVTPLHFNFSPLLLLCFLFLYLYTFSQFFSLSFSSQVGFQSSYSLCYLHMFKFLLAYALFKRKLFKRIIIWKEN